MKALQIACAMDDLPLGPEPFAFAGLWEHWKPKEGQEGEPIDSFTIIVTDANELLKPIHDRMPVILHPEDYALWLEGGPDAADKAEGLLRPFPSERLRAYAVSTRVNSRRIIILSVSNRSRDDDASRMGDSDSWINLHRPASGLGGSPARRPSLSGDHENGKFRVVLTWLNAVLVAVRPFSGQKGVMAMYIHRFAASFATAVLVVGASVLPVSAAGAGGQPVSFAQEVKPILQRRCVKCHQPGGEGYEESGLDLRTYEGLMTGTKYGPMVLPGDPFVSNLMVLLEGRANRDISMPFHQEPVRPCYVKIIKQWIAEGAKNN